MTPTTYFITGSSRGLGLEFVTQVLSRDLTSHIIATARNPSLSPGLQSLKEKYGSRLELLKMDVADQDSIEKAIKLFHDIPIAQNGIDILLHNAGIWTAGMSSISSSTIHDLQTDMNTNVYGVMNVTSSLLPLLRMQGRQKKIWTVSSLGGSIGGPFGEIAPAGMYCVSKAALNMYLRKLSSELSSNGERMAVIAFHPGFVKTPGNPNGQIEVQEAVAKSLKMLENKTEADNGKFWNYDGEVLPW